MEEFIVKIFDLKGGKGKSTSTEKLLKNVPQCIRTEYFPPDGIPSTKVVECRVPYPTATVCVLLKDGNYYVGFSFLSQDDNYSRKEGIRLARERAHEIADVPPPYIKKEQDIIGTNELVFNGDCRKRLKDIRAWFVNGLREQINRRAPMPTALSYYYKPGGHA